MTPREIWDLVHLQPASRLPADIAAWRNTRREAVAALAAAAARMPRITVPLTHWEPRR